MISGLDKTLQTKQDIAKQRKQFYQQLEGECMNTYQQTDDKETKQFWSKIWKRRGYKKKAEWISNKKNYSEGFEEGP